MLRGGGYGGERDALCERIRVQIDSGTIDTVGPKEIAKAFEMKESAMCQRGNGLSEQVGAGSKIMERRRSSDARKKAKESV